MQRRSPSPVGEVPGGGSDEPTSPAGLTSPSDADLRSLASCWAAFRSRPSPRLLATAIAGALVVRILLGAWSWRDAVVPRAS